MILLLPQSFLQTANPLASLLEHFDSSTVLDAELRLIPRLLYSHITSVQRYRYDLYNQPSSSKLPYDVFVSDKARQSARSALSDVTGWINKLELAAMIPAPSIIWACHFAVWEVIQIWGGYMETDPTWAEIVVVEARRGGIALETDNPAVPQEEENFKWVLGTLAKLETLDHVNTAVTPEIIGRCLLVSAYSCAPRCWAHFSIRPPP